jgi:RES domain-containing protein
MPSAVRLTKTRHAATAWDGEGAKRHGGRWNSPGVAVAYASATLSLALVEVLVHLPAGLLPSFSAIRIEFDEELVTPLPPDRLPANWAAHPPPLETQAVGDHWVAEGRTPLLRVPSVVVPSESNYVVNPAFPSFARVRRGAPAPFPFDARLAAR